VSIIDPESADFMILRSWIEPGHEHHLRVRILQNSKDDTSPVISIATTIDDVCTAVRTWLEGLLTHQEPFQPPSQR
jgi:hypothetical protein